MNEQTIISILLSSKSYSIKPFWPSFLVKKVKHRRVLTGLWVKTFCVTINTDEWGDNISLFLPFSWGTVVARDRSKFTGYLGRFLGKFVSKKSLRPPPFFIRKKFFVPFYFLRKSLCPSFLSWNKVFAPIILSEKKNLSPVFIFFQNQP